MIDYDAIAVHVVTENISELPITNTAICFWSGESGVERHATSFWETRANANPTRTFRILTQQPFEILVMVDGKEVKLDLLNRESISELFSKAQEVIIDVTAIRTGVWVPLMIAANESRRSVRIVYIEAAGYQHKTDPVSWNWFELTARTHGFGPIPGLGTLAPTSAMEDAILVILLGFEGVRARRAIAEFDPSPKLVPILALPGRKLHFPHVAVASNYNLFSKSEEIVSVRFAHAADPFEVRKVLAEIRSAYLDRFIHIAAVGTKPHQVGAVLFRLLDNNSDLMYDFPEPRHSTAIGVGRAHFYYIDLEESYETLYT